MWKREIFSFFSLSSHFTSFLHEKGNLHIFCQDAIKYDDLVLGLKKKAAGEEKESCSNHSLHQPNPEMGDTLSAALKTL